MTSNSTPEKLTSKVMWLNSNLLSFWKSCKLTFNRITLRLKRKNVTRRTIPATGWNGIYIQQNALIVRPLIFFEIIEQNDKDVEICGLAFDLGSLFSELGEQLELSGEEDRHPTQHVGYLPPGQTLSEWLAIARENGVNYEEVQKL